ncbi:pirin family protein [Jiangella aurantiaca]|uniref:Pirin family protein n=1 Tax=Jiangella aurantiaca TaxID=2530373 RepID=A0A4R5A257_9ACTN|nr:pirin family protein [Jiangella aurantiaca]TDD64609.1 pirin family protein [Jiangella aurantiaca]
MSNLDARPAETRCHAAGHTGPATKLLDARDVPLGGIRAMRVSRTLPHRELPTVGAWCFLDQFGPQHTDMVVLPHPHTGLQTVTWPVQGEIHHRDSVGSDVVVRPGQLNLMTSGPGIAHSEISLGEAPLLHGLQLWVALPEAAANHAAPGFEQHTDLPVHDGDGVRATVVVGELAGTTSPATTYSPLLGAQLDVDAGTTAVLPMTPDFEHAVLVLTGRTTIAGTPLEPGPLLYLGTGRSELVLQAHDDDATLFLLGGEPFPDDLVMWWNFVGRSHEDIVAAREDWERPGQHRFGPVAGHGADRIPAPPLPPLRLTPRRRRATPPTS